jgi:hypothetical protein
VTPKNIHIAVFNDASNTVLPGLEREFVQFAQAFAAWCNASGGINGRHIVIDNRDAAVFNAGQVASQACQSDFMAIGGGLVFDNQSTPVRVACGLGSITGYTVSDVSAGSTLQVNPSNINPSYDAAGWFAALAHKYPKAVKAAAFTTANNPNDLEPEKKWADSAVAAGWNVTDFQTTPIAVSDWTPYVQQFQTKGIQALWPDPVLLTPYLQAMSTVGFHPAFALLSTQFYTPSTIKAVAGLHLPPMYIETNWWPLEMAAQSPSTEQLLQVMHTYAKGDVIDYDDEEAAESWLLWAKAASACGSNNLTVSCVLSNAASEKNWTAGGIEAPQAKLALSNENPVPGPCFALLQVTPKGFVYAKSITRPTQSIWNCDPKNVLKLTSQQLAAING